MRDIKEAVRRYIIESGNGRFSLKSVLFDMDGVLYDSMPYHTAAWIEVMRRYGFDMLEQEAYLHEGRTGAGTIDILAAQAGKLVTEAEKAAIYGEKAELFEAMVNASSASGDGKPLPRPIAGAATLLGKVTACGLKAMLVTGSGQPSLLERLQEDFPGVFDRERMVTSFDVKRGKPDPEPYLMALEKGGLHPNEAIVVENAPLGVEAARAAGLFTIAVNTGPLPDSALLEAGANALFPSMEALANDWEAVFLGFS
jgi:beta-phosphoglucomutase-like phosphatase (HAD superfamily)